MKTSFLAVTLLALLVLGAHDLQAQVYGPYYYEPYWEGIQYQQYLQQYDAYYELHVLPAISAGIVRPQAQAIIRRR